MEDDQSQTTDIWTDFVPGKAEIEFISNYLFEKEVPLTDKELIPLLVEERIRKEHEMQVKKQRGNSQVYCPKERFEAGDELVFPVLNWKKGKVVSIRPGINPTLGKFEVAEIAFDEGNTKQFASGLDDHKLNQIDEMQPNTNLVTVQSVMDRYGDRLAVSIAKGLRADGSLVQIAGRWFPRALLIDINMGHLNLVEAILDEAGGKPLSTPAIIEQVGLPGINNPKLLEFSINYALQEDDRFDEVGPAGEVLWCLKRLEPEDVQHVPAPLRYEKTPYDRSLLDNEMVTLEAAIDDEYGESAPAKEETEIVISLSYPHWRVGTLPVSMRTKKLFPTAYESERVRFRFVDAVSKEEIPAWVVRKHGYVAGLKNFYQKYGVIPGSLISLRRGQHPGQVIIEARVRRPMRDWVRTVLVGSDGGIVFANLKQNLTTEVNDRMVVAVPDVESIDKACELISRQNIPFETLVMKVMKELTKLNIQGHIHAQELYSALNIIRRCPVAPLLAHLAVSPEYRHVGDLHYRIVEREAENE